MTSETKSLVVEMSAGIVIWNLFLAFAGCVFAPLMGWSRISMLLGVVIGMAAAVVMLIHMAVITEKVLDSADQSYANKTTVIHSMIRKFVYIILLILLFLIYKGTPAAFGRPKFLQKSRRATKTRGRHPSLLRLGKCSGKYGP